MERSPNEHAEGSTVLNMTRYLLVFKRIFQKIAGQTDKHKVINGSIVHIGKGIFHSENLLLLLQHDQIFTGFEVIFSKIPGQTDVQT